MTELEQRRVNKLTHIFQTRVHLIAGLMPQFLSHCEGPFGIIKIGKKNEFITQHRTCDNVDMFRPLYTFPAVFVVSIFLI